MTDCVRLARPVLMAVCLLGVATALDARQTRPPAAEIVFRNVTVVDVRTGRLTPRATIVVRGSFVESVDATGRATIPPGATVVDGQAAFVIPGLWDMHVHTFNNSQAAGTDNHATYFPLQIANGVTGVRDTWTDTDDLQLARAWREEMDAGRMIGPRLSGTSAILDGSPRVWPNSLELTSPRQAEEAVDRLAAAGAGAFKVYNNLTPETYRAIVERARHHGKPVVGHSPRAVGARQAAEAGQKSLEHLNGIADGCSAQGAARTRGDTEEGRAARTLLIDTYDARRCGTLFELFVREGTWQVPTLILHRGRLLAFEPSRMRAPELAYASAEEHEAWAAVHARNVERVTVDPTIPSFRRQSLALLLRITGDLHRAGVGILAGTDLGNPWVVPGFALHDELALFVEAGMTPLEALRTATVNPARYLNQSDSLGSIEAGKLADFVLLGANPLADIAHTKTIRAVVTNGRYLDRQALDALLSKARLRQAP